MDARKRPKRIKKISTLTGVIFIVQKILYYI
nr:MAG TPA: hypothetical protein [Caudoviricetes sp.]